MGQLIHIFKHYTAPPIDLKVGRLFWFLMLICLLPAALQAQVLHFLADQVAGPGTAQVRVEVLDATATTGDQYQLTFTEANDRFFYSIENLTTQTTVIDGVPETMVSPVFEGLRVSISTIDIPYYEDFIEVSYNGVPVNPPAHIFRPGDRQGEGGNNSSNEYTFVGGGGSGDLDQILRSEDNTAFFDYELRFDGNPDNRNKLVYPFNGGEGILDVPFSAWNIGISTPNDPSDDYQVIIAAFDDSGNPASYDGGAVPSDGGLGTMFDRLYFREIYHAAGAAGDINGDSLVNYDDFLQDIIDNGDISSVLLERDYTGVEVLSRFSMVALNNNVNYIPPVGTTIRITTTNRLTSRDVFQFNSTRFELVTPSFEIEFGDAQVGSQSIAPLILINNGSNTLNISDIVSSSPDFQAQQTSLSISAGDSAFVPVIFAPTAEVHYLDSLMILSDDAIFPQYRVYMQGEGLPPATAIISLRSRTLVPNIGHRDLWGYYDDATQREYAIVGGNGVTIVDVTVASNPQIVSQVLNISGDDVKVWDHYLYTVSSAFSTSRIIDIADPANPQVVGSFPGAKNIFITDDGFMIAERFGMKIYGLHPDPTDPVFIFTAGNEGNDAVVVNNRIYDFHSTEGTFIYDFSDRFNTTLLTSIIDTAISFNGSGYPSEDGNYLFINNPRAEHPEPDIVVYDISNINSPVRVGEFGDSTASIHNLFVQGDYALTSYFTGGFKVLDISDPTRPVLADQYDTSPFNGEEGRGAVGIYPFAPSGNIYISDVSTGLHIFRLDLPTSVDPEPVPAAQEFALHNNFPNPFNPETQIRYQISDIRNQNGNDRPINLVVFDVQGRKVRTLVNGNKQPGSYTVSWDGRDDNGHQVASGLYFYRLTAGAFKKTRKMILIR